MPSNTQPNTINELFGDQPRDRDEIIAALSAMIDSIIGEDLPLEFCTPELRRTRVHLNKLRDEQRQRATALGFQLPNKEGENHGRFI